MMLDINIERLREGFWRNLPLAIVVGGVLVFEMIAVLANRIYGARPRELPPGYSNTKDWAAFCTPTTPTPSRSPR